VCRQFNSVLAHHKNQGVAEKYRNPFFLARSYFTAIGTCSEHPLPFEMIRVITAEPSDRETFHPVEAICNASQLHKKTEKFDLRWRVHYRLDVRTATEGNNSPTMFTMHGNHQDGGRA
jgi:hypothetical protein